MTIMATRSSSLREQIPALYASKLIEEVMNLDADPRPALKAAGLRAAQLGDPQHLIPIPQYLRLLEDLLARTHNEDLGMRVGLSTTLVEHGMQGYAVLSSVNLGEALKRITRYIHLTGSLLNLVLDTTKRKPVLTLAPRRNWVLSEAATRYLTEEFIANLYQVGKALEIKPGWFAGISLSYPRPAYASRYARRMACPVTYNCVENAIVFKSECYELPMPLAGIQASTMCETVCDLLLKDIKDNAGISSKIHRLLAYSPGEVLTMKRVAEELNTSVRSLRRHLLIEATTYREIVTEFRFALAGGYLRQTKLPASEIAILLGYTEPVNFYRAFRKYYSTSCKKFRYMHQK